VMSKAGDALVLLPHPIVVVRAVPNILQRLPDRHPK
jgi:hypothetical protein